jgi:hypothetical protein
LKKEKRIKKTRKDNKNEERTKINNEVVALIEETENLFRSRNQRIRP